jgi:hypothetical protein
VGLFALILGINWGIILILLYILLTVTLIFYWFLVNWCVILTFGYALWETVYQIWLMVVLATPYFVLWIMDLVTGGVVTRIMRCENLPDDWMNVSGFAEGNQWERMGFGCFAPCGDRYGTFGCFCHKRSAFMPSACPQQQIARLFMGKSPIGSPSAFTTYTPDARFGSRTLASKQNVIVDAYRQKMAWYQTCYASLHDYDFLNRHVCNNVAEAKKKMSDSEYASLITLCKECYCDYQPDSYKTGVVASMTSEADRASNPTCVSLASAAPPAPKDASTPATALMRKVFLMGMLVVVVLAMVYSMLQASSKMHVESLAVPYLLSGLSGKSTGGLGGLASGLLSGKAKGGLGGLASGLLSGKAKGGLGGLASGIGGIVGKLGQ